MGFASNLYNSGWAYWVWDRGGGSSTLDDEIITQLLSSSVISFLVEGLNILCSDIFKWASVLHRGYGSHSSRLKTLSSQGENFIVNRCGMHALF